MGFRIKNILWRISIIFFIIITSPRIIASPQLDTIDTPTAATLYKGGYSISI
jgi:hypothetical protein